jgi:predicted dehydrogenase
LFFIMSEKKLRLGMIGGGRDAFIGAVHRIAARMDGLYGIVCGAFSSDAQKSAETGKELGLNASRVYGSYKEMFEKELLLPENERMQVVSIVTPNHLHFEPAKLAMENGFDVILDKPITFSLAEAKQLREVINNTGRLFCLTHTYTGYPMVKEARQQVMSGRFGKIRKVYVEYPQGWLSTFLESTSQKQAAWRTDPARSGIAGSMGDIGTHAFNLAEYVSGLSVTAICAALNTVVEGRLLDDDGAVLLRFNNGATGVLMATQVAAGEENNVKIRVYGETGGIEWKQEDANSLIVKWLDKPAETYRAGTGYLSAVAAHNCRTPAGHPEGYLEAFANLYRNFGLTVEAVNSNTSPQAAWLDFPGVEEGIRGMAFVENVVKSSASDMKWMDFEV